MKGGSKGLPQKKPLNRRLLTGGELRLWPSVLVL